MVFHLVVLVNSSLQAKVNAYYNMIIVCDHLGQPLFNDDDESSVSDAIPEFNINSKVGSLLRRS